MQRILVLVLVTITMVGCRQAVIRNIEDTPIVRYDNRPLSLEEVERAIVYAGAELGWRMQPVEPGNMIGILDLRSHKAVVDIVYDANSYSIHYKDSENLLYEAPNIIHRKYNNWVANLIKNINASVQRIQ